MPQYDWTTGVPDNGNEWRKFRAVPRLYPLRSLVRTFFNKGGSRGAFRLPGASGDHFPLYGATFARSYSVSRVSGKEKAHKHKQIFPVTARAGGGVSRPGGGGGLPTGVEGSKVYVLCAEPKEHKRFRPVTRPGGIGFPAGRIGDRGVTEKLFMCQMFMCLFRPLERGKSSSERGL